MLSSSTVAIDVSPSDSEGVGGLALGGWLSESGFGRSEFCHDVEELVWVLVVDPWITVQSRPGRCLEGSLVGRA